MRTRFRRAISTCGLVLMLGLGWGLANPSRGFSGTPSNEPAKSERWFQYTNDVIDDLPWSIHIIKVERASSEAVFYTTLGKGDTFGMGTVSEQIKTVPAQLGQPLAAINGDFYEKSEKHHGRPRDLQIRQGEVVSSPAGHACFWLAPDGTPHATNVFSRFRVTWENGKTLPVGLNQVREDDSAVLYTAVDGKATPTTDGMELILEAASNGPWLPLRVGQVYSAKVRAVRDTGGTPLTKDTLVLSLGPKLISLVPALKPGLRLQITTETVPDLSGVTTAIGGGPTLVRNGKPMEWTGFIKMRHPRAAIGWNKDFIFLVEVDGRQSNISVGMTFPELASYLTKLGCEEAMNFDGGGSATLWALGAVRNSPSEGDERPAPNALVVVRKRPLQAQGQN